jgi:hypothetical protein
MRSPAMAALMTSSLASGSEGLNAQGRYTE